MKADNQQAIESFWEEHKDRLFRIAAFSIKKRYGNNLDPAVSHESLAGEVLAQILREKKFPEIEEEFMKFFMKVSERRAIDQQRSLCGHNGHVITGTKWQRSISLAGQPTKAGKKEKFVDVISDRNADCPYPTAQIKELLKSIIGNFEAIIDNLEYQHKNGNIQKQVVLLRFGRGLSAKEIAQELGIKPNTADKYISISKPLIMADLEQRRSFIDKAAYNIIERVVLERGDKHASLMTVYDELAKKSYQPDL